MSGSCIAMNPYAPAPDVVIASPPQIGQDQGQEPFEVSQHAGCWIWTSENAPLLGTSVKKGKSTCRRQVDTTADTTERATRGNRERP